MTYLLYGLAALSGLAPFVIWGYLVLLGCAYANSGNCSISVSDYLDAEFLTLAILPWAISLISLMFARRNRSR